MVGSWRESSRGLGSAPEYDPHGPPVAWLPLLGFPAPSAFLGIGKRLRRVCLARLCSAFRLLRPLDALLLPNRSGFVSRRIRSWGSPFRGFPSGLAGCASRRPCPSWSSWRTSRIARVRPLPSSVGCVQVTFRDLSVSGVRSSCRWPLGLRREPTPLLVFQPSRVFPLPATTRPLSCLLSCTSRCRAPKRSRSLCSRVSVRRKVGLSLARPPTLMSFSSSSLFEHPL